MTVTSPEALEEFGFYIGGEVRMPRRGRRFESVDPASGSAWAHISDADAYADDVIATKAQFDKIAGFVERARSERAEIVAGGRRWAACEDDVSG